MFVFVECFVNLCFACWIGSLITWFATVATPSARLRFRSVLVIKSVSSSYAFVAKLSQNYLRIVSCYQNGISLQVAKCFSYNL